jgi:hypothetical protein
MDDMKISKIKYQTSKRQTVGLRSKIKKKKVKTIGDDKSPAGLRRAFLLGRRA